MSPRLRTSGLVVVGAVLLAACAPGETGGPRQEQQVSRPGRAPRTPRVPSDIPPEVLQAQRPEAAPPERCGAAEVLKGWDFEGGTLDDSWYTDGTAFLEQPTWGENISARRFSPSSPLAKLGGDYWDGARPVGVEGNWWVGTAERRHSAAQSWGAFEGTTGRTGTATTSPFIIASGYIHVLVGGTSDGARTAVELWTEANGLDEAAERIARLMGNNVSPGMVFQGRRFLRRQTLSPMGGEMLQPRVFDVRGLYENAVAILRLVDSSSTGHLNVDSIRCLNTDAAPYPPRPLWGLADTHTHPMMHQGFGGLRGIKSVWGVPGGDVLTYSGEGGKAAYQRDVPACDARGHGGGNSSALLIKGTEMRLDPESLVGTMLGRIAFGVMAGAAAVFGAYVLSIVVTGAALLGPFLPLGFIVGIAVSAALVANALDHHNAGPPGYQDAPTFFAGAHEQQHITGFRRAFEGGLRVISALAVTSNTMEFMMGHVENDTLLDHENARIAITPTRDLVEAHVCGMKEMASLNADWMEIAYSPSDIRRIVGQDKLAVVLGLEVPNLGSVLGRITDAAGAQAEVEWLHNLGIRHVLPIHSRNNAIGGAAIFQDAYAGDNDLFNRGEFGSTVQWLGSLQGRLPRTYFEVEEAGCGVPGPMSARGSCVLYTLNPKQTRLGVDFLLQIALFPSTSWFEDSIIPGYRFGVNDQGNPVNHPRGHMNPVGLIPETGVPYIRALMNRGMLLDLAHMGDRTAAQTVEQMRALSPACTAAPILDSSSLDAVRLASSRECLEGTYPALVSHVNFRAQSIHEDARVRFDNSMNPVLSPVPTGLSPEARTATSIKDWLPSEWELSDPLVDMLGATGGLISPFMNQDPIETPPWQTLPPGLNNDCMRSSQEWALAMDYATTRMHGRGVALASDMGLHPLTSPRFGPDACWISNFGRVFGPERGRQPGRYHPERQANAVRYGTDENPLPQQDPVRADQPLLTPLKMPRQYDFNQDGLAQYGMVVDQLQDARNVGMPRDAMNTLFRSAEDYVSMWERAWRVAGCAPGDARCGGPVNPPLHEGSMECRAACHGTCPGDTAGGIVYSPRDAGPPGPHYPEGTVRVDGGVVVPVDHFVPECTPFSYCLGTNLLRNPGFETASMPATGAGLLPDDWFSTHGTPDTYSMDGMFGLEAMAGGLFVRNGAGLGQHWVAAASADGDVFGQRLIAPLIPGHTYQLGGWFLQADRADVSNAGGFAVTLTDAQNASVSPVSLGRFCSLGYGAWELRAITFTAPADAALRPDLLLEPVAYFEGQSVSPGVDEMWLVDTTECPDAFMGNSSSSSGGASSSSSSVGSVSSSSTSAASSSSGGGMSSSAPPGTPCVAANIDPVCGFCPASFPAYPTGEVRVVQTPLASGAPYARAGTRVYWILSNQDLICSYDNADQSMRLEADLRDPGLMFTPGALGVAQNRLFWGDTSLTMNGNWGISRVNTPNGMPGPFAENPRAASVFASDGTSLFVSTITSTTRDVTLWKYDPLSNPLAAATEVYSTSATALDKRGISGLTVANGYLYWADSPTFNCGAGSTRASIQRRLLDMSAPAEIVVGTALFKDCDDVDSLQVVGGDVYFSVIPPDGSSTLRKYSAGSVTPLSTMVDITTFLVTPRHIYFSSGGRQHRIPTAGGASTVVSGYNQVAYDFFEAQGYVYWFGSNGGLWRTNDQD